MTRDDLRRLRLRFLLLPLVALCCVVVSAFQIRRVAGEYSYHVTEFAGMRIAPEQVSFEPAGMAECVGVEYHEDGVPILHLVARERGEGFGLISLEESGGMFQVRVRAGNVLVVDGVNFNGWQWVSGSLMVCMGVAAFLCVAAVVKLVRRAWYGYEMASYLGFAIFFTYQLFNVLNAMCSQEVWDFVGFAIKFLGLASDFVQATIVPLALLAVFVCLSNVVLVRREGRSFHNLLGILSSIGLVATYFVWSLIDPNNATGMDQFIVYMVINMLIGVAISFAIALLLATCICAWSATRHTPSRPRDYLIILGCAIRADGTPTPLLAGRADAALSFAQRQEAEGHPAPTFVPSGGQGSDEVCSEAASIAGHLQRQGVAPDHILLEDRSTSTRENFAFSADLIRAAAGTTDPRVAFATTNYHVFRGYVYAHDAGLAAEGISAPTKLYFWPNAFLREFVGLVVSRRIPIIITYLLTALLYGFCEYVMLLS